MYFHLRRCPQVYLGKYFLWVLHFTTNSAINSRMCWILRPKCIGFDSTRTAFRYFSVSLLPPLSCVSRQLVPSATTEREVLLPLLLYDLLDFETKVQRIHSLSCVNFEAFHLP